MFCNLYTFLKYKFKSTSFTFQSYKFQVTHTNMFLVAQVLSYTHSSGKSFQSIFGLLGRTNERLILAKQQCFLNFHPIMVRRGQGLNLLNCTFPRTLLRTRWSKNQMVSAFKSSIVFCLFLLLWTVHNITLQ